MEITVHFFIFEFVTCWGGCFVQCVKIVFVLFKQRAECTLDFGNVMHMAVSYLVNPPSNTF